MEAKLASLGWLTRARVSRRGNESGGVPYSRGMLFHMLKNRVYVGDIVHAGKAAQGLHPPIVDRDVFSRVQARLATNSVTLAERPLRSADLALRGKLFDADGHPMSPSFGYGRGRRVYRYYISAPLQQGRGSELDAEAAIRRVTAETIHEVVTEAVGPRIGIGATLDVHAVVSAVERVDLLAEEVRIVLNADRLTPKGRKGLVTDTSDLAVLTVPVRCRRRGGRVELVLPPGAQRQRGRRDPALIRGLQQAHRLATGLGWNSADGSISEPALRQLKGAYERKLVRLAFIAPDVQRAFTAGLQSPGLTLARLLNEPIPTDWADQRRAFT